MRTLLLISLLTLTLGSFSQDEMGKHSISLNVGGTSIFAGASYEYFINNNLQLDCGIGYSGFGVGLNYYPWKRKMGSIRPYVGVSPRLISNFWNYFHPFFAASVGVTWFMNNRFNLAVAFEPSFVEVTYDTYPISTGYTFYPWANIKFTYRIGE